MVLTTECIVVDKPEPKEALPLAAGMGGDFDYFVVLIDLHVLEAFDALLWLRTAEEVERRYGTTQTTISRYRQRCLALFELAMERRHGEWELIGDSTLLLRERQVHQLARWRCDRPLRLEATYWSAPLLSTPSLAGWVLGVSNIVGVRRIFQLVEERVVDALITGLPDLPTQWNPDLTAIPIIRMPAFYVAAPGHPLFSRPQLSVEQIAEFPSLALPEGSYPLVEQALRSLGLWNDGVRMTRYRQDLWEGRAERDLVVGYGTALSLAVSGSNLRRLPLQLPFTTGDALVVRREFEHHPRLQALLLELHRRYLPMVGNHDDVDFDPGFLARVVT
jgi:hypothetical protein